VLLVGKPVRVVAIAGSVAFALLLVYMWDSHIVQSTLHPGFTDAQVREIEQSIEDYYAKKLRESPSAAEREELANGSTTVTAKMLKVSSRRLEGFVKFTLRDEASRSAGLDELLLNCEATMDVDSTQWMWKCQNK
jgi:hypothetical protein